MKPLEFSEFSYGFALTDSLRHSLLGGFVAAPVLPSLVNEGRQGGGYDIQIFAHPRPLFLQFKVPQLLQRRSKLIPPNFNVPYYRMHIRPLKYSNQHQLLMSLESAGELVYYVCPRFHLLQDLNRYFGSYTVSSNSAYVHPSAIGLLPDQHEHYVAFEPNASFGFCYSQKPFAEVKVSYEFFVAEISRPMEGIPRDQDLDTIFEKLYSLMSTIIQDTGEIKRRLGHEFVEKSLLSQPARGAAYLARLYFDSELFIMGRKEQQ